MDNNTARYQIISVAPDYIQVNDQKLISPFILSASQLTPWKSVSVFEDLKPEDFNFLTALSTKPEILLLATGLTLKIPPDSLLSTLFKQGIGVEFMDTRSACHTFSILTSEDRNVLGCFFIL